MPDSIVLPTHHGFKNLTGRTFGRLTVISYAGFIKAGSGRATAWICRCECGKGGLVIAGNSLLTGNSSSCGCRQREVARIRCTTHGLSSSPEYLIWNQMKQRCGNPERQNYGERGIKVCKRWTKFQNFYADMGPRPSTEHSLERINNNGNYEPGNCRWATWSEQMRNTRQNRVLEFRGAKRTIAEWCEITGLSKATLSSRIRRCWSIEKALTTPSPQQELNELRGEVSNLTMLVRRLIRKIPDSERSDNCSVTVQAENYLKNHMPDGKILEGVSQPIWLSGPQEATNG